MKTLKISPLLLLSLALFPACAKKKEDPKPPQPVVATPPSAVGKWLSDCQLDTTTNSHYRIELEFTDKNQLIETVLNYNDTACSGSVPYSALVQSEVTIEGLHGDSKTLVDVKLKAFETDLRPGNSDVANSWNQENYGLGRCNISDWTTGTNGLRSVAPDCLQGHDGNDVIVGDYFTILSIDGNVLQRGRRSADHNGAQPSARPTDLFATKFVKEGSDFTTQCPAFAAVYDCAAQGDVDFNGAAVSVTKGTNAFQFASPQKTLVYVVDGQSHSKAVTPFTTLTENNSCVSDANGAVMNTHYQITSSNDPSITIQDRTFRLVNGSLLIDTTDTVKQNANDNGNVSFRRIQCRPR
jgi:hypothetical protein